MKIEIYESYGDIVIRVTIKSDTKKRRKPFMHRRDINQCCFFFVKLKAHSPFDTRGAIVWHHVNTEIETLCRRAYASVA